MTFAPNDMTALPSCHLFREIAQLLCTSELSPVLTLRGRLSVLPGYLWDSLYRDLLGCIYRVRQPLFAGAGLAATGPALSDPSGARRAARAARCLAAGSAAAPGLFGRGDAAHGAGSGGCGLENRWGRKDILVDKLKMLDNHNLKETSDIDMSDHY